MTRRFALAFLLLLAPALYATQPVTGTLRDGKGNPTSKGYITATLVNCGANAPKVIGTGIIADRTVKFSPATDGTISDVILGNDQIDCGGTHNSLWQIQLYANGLPVGSPLNYAITAPFNLDNPPPPAVAPIPPTSFVSYATQQYVDNHVPDLSAYYTKTQTDAAVNVKADSSTLSAETTRATTAEGTKAANAAVVHNTGDETVAGNKTFTGSLAVGTTVLLKDGIQPINVMAKGAKCDGTTDDASVIQAAIDGASAGNTVLIPAHCAVGSTITLPATTKNISIHGVTLAQSRLIALPSLTGNMLYKADGFVPDPVSFQDLTLDCNKNAAHALEFVSYRKIKADTLQARDCTGTPYIFGGVSVGGYNIGLTAHNLDVEETNYVIAAGVAARPDYGIEMRGNVYDSTLDVALVNHVKIAGLLLAGSVNRVTNFHPWGYSSAGSIPNSAPQYGIVVTGLANIIDKGEFDGMTVAGVKQSGNRLVVINSTFLNDTIDGTPYMVEADNGTDSLSVTHSTLAGNWNVNPIHWLGATGNFTWAFDNGFASTVYWPYEFMFPKGWKQQNNADSDIFAICRAGLTEDHQCVTEYTDYAGNTIFRVGKRANNSWVIYDPVNNLPFFLSQVGLATYINSEGANSVQINTWTGSGTKGLTIGSGGATPATVATIDETGKSTVKQSIVKQTDAALSGAYSYIDAMTGKYASQGWLRNGLNRWSLAMNNDAEAGANAGSTLYMDRSDDAGTSLGNIFTIRRSDGLTTWSTPHTFSAGLTGTLTGTASGNVLPTRKVNDKALSADVYVESYIYAGIIPTLSGVVGTSNGLSFPLVRDAVIDQLQMISLATRGLTCSTLAQLAIYDNGVITTCVMTVNNNDWMSTPTSCNVSVAAGHSLTLKVSQQAAGCGTLPANGTFNIAIH